jgi:two-component system, NarL family, nitrate/nitrite response regulator NarL
MHILLVDDHTLFREALQHVLRQLDLQVIVLEAANIDEAKYLISNTRNLDLILLDIELPGVDGLSALPDIRERAPTVPIVVLSGSEAAEHVKKAVENGAVGYIPKTCSSYEMQTALHIVLQGDVYVPPKLLGKLEVSSLIPITGPDNDAKLMPLTPRQLEVLELMVRGLPNKSIANKLNVAEGTVKLHVAAIMRSLGCRNRTQAVTEAARLGLVLYGKDKMMM